MAVQALPLLIAAGAAVVLTGKKKKRRKSRVGDSCDQNSKAPKGFLCEDGLLREDVVDESDLDSDEDLSKEESGDFDTNEEGVGAGDDEESGEAGGHADPEPDPKQMCEEFMATIHVTPSQPGELPINEVAVEETALPAMKAQAEKIRISSGNDLLDFEAAGPALVLAALRALIPVCSWTYDDSGFKYNSTHEIDSEIAREVLHGLIELSVAVIQDHNTPKQSQGESMDPSQP